MLSVQLLIVLIGVGVGWAAAYKEYSSRSLLKLRCYQCNQPYDCGTGTCFGDACVKSLVNQHYVSKGCENLTVSGSVYEPHLKLKAYCKEEEVLGVDTVTCYCRDNDFCNATSTPSSFAGLAALVALLRISQILF